jgi:hypothetical protein
MTPKRQQKFKFSMEIIASSQQSLPKNLEQHSTRLKIIVGFLTLLNIVSDGAFYDLTDIRVCN